MRFFLGQRMRRDHAPAAPAPEQKGVYADDYRGYPGWGPGGSGSVSGPPVDHNTAFGASAVLACVRVIAQGVAQMPLSIEQRTLDGQQNMLRDHPVHRVLARRPARWMTPFDFRQLMVTHAALTGAGRAIIMRRRRGGQLLGLEPIPPRYVRVRIRDEDGEPEFLVRLRSGEEKAFRRDEIFEVRGPGWETYRSWDVTWLARESIGLSLATEETHARFHNNSVRPSGVLKTPGALDPDQVAELRAAWNQFGGVRNAMGTQVLTGGLEWQQVSMTGVDAQHLETRRYQVEEIARAFGVFPVVIGHSDKAQTFATAEQFFLHHVIHSLGPWVERFEQSVDMSFLSAMEMDAGIGAKLDVQALLRGSAQVRASYYHSGIHDGWLTPNEAREREGLSRLEGLDEPFHPLNMGSVEQPMGADQ